MCRIDLRQVMANLALGVLAAVLASGELPVYAQSSGEEEPVSNQARSVEVTYQVYSEDKAPEKARELAVDRAQAEAVRRVVGTQVQAERMSSSVESGQERVERFSQVVRTGASGRVVDSEVLEATTVRRGGKLFYKVQLRVTVAPEQGQPDPSFSVDVSLNEKDRVYLDRGTPKESQELVASFRTTKDAHLTVFNVTPDTMRVVWPNSRLPDTSVPADSTVEFPPPDMRRLGLRWRVDGPPGPQEVTERIVVVATKKKIPFQPVPDYQVQNGKLKTAGASIEALNRWLVELPLDQRTVTTATYKVKKASTTQ
jgi:hypothetical protein